MQAWTLEHVSFWLEAKSGNDIAFSHALEWAFRLELPLRITAITNPPVTEKIRNWNEAAALRGVGIEMHLTMARTQGAVDQFLRANGLCVFSEASDAYLTPHLMRRSAQIQSICQLLCPRVFSPIDRVLVVCRDADWRAQYLESAARICQSLNTTPIVLILAGSECDAKLKQEFAEGIFHSRQMLADIDFVIDRDPVLAVNRIVSWRRCTHVIMSRSSRESDSFQRDLSATVSVLTLPDVLSLELPRRIASSRKTVSRIHVDETQSSAAREIT